MANTQAKLEDKIGQLVDDAERMVRHFFPPRPRPRDDEKKDESPGKTQLSNAIDVIVQSKSIEVFTNWIRYQMARELEKTKGKREDSGSRDKFWTVQKDSKMFGSEVITYASSLKDAYGTDPNEAIRQLNHFLGFLRRAFIARDLLGILPAFEEGKKS